MCVSVKLLCGLEASQGAVEEVLSSAVSVIADALDSSDDLDPEEEEESETKVAHKKKNKRRKGIICNLFWSMQMEKNESNTEDLHRTYMNIYCDVCMFSQRAVRAVTGQSIQWTFG